VRSDRRYISSNSSTSEMWRWTFLSIIAQGYYLGRQGQPGYPHWIPGARTCTWLPRRLSSVNWKHSYPGSVFCAIRYYDLLYHFVLKLMKFYRLDCALSALPNYVYVVGILEKHPRKRELTDFSDFYWQYYRMNSSLLFIFFNQNES